MLKAKRFFSTTLALLLLSFQMISVYAHDGQPRLELGAERISPGADLDVRGINIAAEQSVMLALVGADAEWPLGTAVGDVHGDFTLGVKLPREALAGAYHVRAFGANRVVVTAPLTLVGAAYSEEGEQRDQSEPLLAPMPQPNFAAQPQAVAQPQRSQAAIPIRSEEQSASMSPALLVVGALATALALALAVALVIRRGRRDIRPSEQHKATSPR